MDNILTITAIICALPLVTSCDDLFKSRKKSNASLDQAAEIAKGQRLYDEKCSSCHGKLIDSTKKQASFERVQAAINSVPGMENLRGLSKDDIKAISAALGSEDSSKNEGAKLYAANCASCHGTLRKSQKINKSAAQIKSAITSQPTMQNIKLSDFQINNIAAALSAAGSQSLAEAMPELRDRTMLASRLKRVFTMSSQADRTRVYSIIDTEILNHPEAFGGNCSRSDAGGESDPACTFKSGYESYHTAGSVAKAQLIRSWRLDRACKSIAAQNPVAVFVASSVGGNIQSPPAEVHAIKFANLLSPGYEMKSDSVKSSLAELLRAAKTYNSETQWRLMIYGVCGSLVSEKL